MTAKMAKGSSEGFQKVSKVLCESPNAKIHAVVELDFFSFTLLSSGALSLCFNFAP